MILRLICQSALLACWVIASATAEEPWQDYFDWNLEPILRPSEINPWKLKATSPGEVNEKEKENPNIRESDVYDFRRLRISVTGTNPTNQRAELQVFVFGVRTFEVPEVLSIQKERVLPGGAIDKTFLFELSRYRVSTSRNLRPFHSLKSTGWVVRVVQDGKLVACSGQLNSPAIEAVTITPAFCAKMLAYNNSSGKRLVAEQEALEARLTRKENVELVRWLYELANIELVKARRLTWDGSTTWNSNQKPPMWVKPEYKRRLTLLADIVSRKAAIPENSPRKSWLESYARFCSAMSSENEKAARSELPNLVKP